MTYEAAQKRRLARRKLKSSLFGVLCFLSALIGVLLLVVLLAKIGLDGFHRLNLKFLTQMPSYLASRTGIWAALVGSFYVMLLTGLIAVPVGVAAAVYLEEFQRRKGVMTRFIQVNISNLAGVPSIVYGLLGLALFVRWLNMGQSVLAGALTMSLLILPMVIIVTQEALRAVPGSYREGALALGCTQWQTIRLQVLPSATSGILTGVILSLSRAIGETAPLIVVGAVSFVTALPKSLSDRYTVLPIQIFDWSGDPRKSFAEAAASAIIVLIVVLLSMNSVAIIVRNRSRKRQAR